MMIEFFNYLSVLFGHVLTDTIAVYIVHHLLNR